MRGSAVTRDRLAIACAAVAALAAGLAALSPAPVGVFWDDAVYVITAKALATGQGYHYIHLPGTPSAVHYPPLWPLLLSAVWRVAPAFPDNVHLMKLLNPALLAVAAAGATVLAMRAMRVRAWIAAAVVGSSIAVAPLLLLSAVLMSEPLCLAISAWALAAATLALMRGRVKDAVLAGALVGLAVLARSAAIVLLPSLAVGLCWRRSRRASAIALGVSAAFVLPWFAWSGAHAAEVPRALAGSYGPYASWILDAYVHAPGLLVDVVRQNLAAVFHDSGVVLFGGLPRGIRLAFVVPLCAMTVTGLVLAGRRAAPLSVALAGYAALIVVWPYPPGRFMWAFFPLYAVGTLAAAVAFARRARRVPRNRAHNAVWRASAYGAVALGALTLAMVARYDARGFQRGWHRMAIDQNAESIVAPVAWIASHTAPTDTLATDVHLLAYLYAGRIAVPLNSLTVAEHVYAKSEDAMRLEFIALDSTFHPRWWIASGMVPERFALIAWATDSTSGLRPVAPLPGGGIAARVVAR